MPLCITILANGPVIYRHHRDSTIPGCLRLVTIISTRTDRQCYITAITVALDRRRQ